MEQWESKTLAWVYRNPGVWGAEDGKELGSRDGSPAWLGTYADQLGRLGWELVGVTNVSDPETGSSGPVYFFKRQL
jgi:hypothetical protein